MHTRNIHPVKSQNLDKLPMAQKTKNTFLIPMATQNIIVQIITRKFWLF